MEGLCWGVFTVERVVLGSFYSREGCVGEFLRLRGLCWGICMVERVVLGSFYG